MSECVDCGRDAPAAATYCDECADRDVHRDTSPRNAPAAKQARVASPMARAVAVLLSAATALGGFAVARTLQYVPQVIATARPIDAVGFLAASAVRVTLLATFAVMAKRLLDGTANVARYGRFLRTFAVASIAFGVAVTTLPEPVSRWLPTVLDPAYVALNALAFYVAPGSLFDQWQTFAVGTVGVTLSFVAGSALVRDAKR